MYALEDLWSGKINLHEKGFPSAQYARAMRKLADCGETLMGGLNDGEYPDANLSRIRIKQRPG